MLLLLSEISTLAFLALLVAFVFLDLLVARTTSTPLVAASLLARLKYVIT